MNAALDWARGNIKVIGKGTPGAVPKWKGLVRVHALEEEVGVCERHRLAFDDVMGIRFDSGIRHVGI
jgi:hypothetical protein